MRGNLGPGTLPPPPQTPPTKVDIPTSPNSTPNMPPPQFYAPLGPYSNYNPYQNIPKHTNPLLPLALNPNQLNSFPQPNQINPLNPATTFTQPVAQRMPAFTNNTQPNVQKEDTPTNKTNQAQNEAKKPPLSPKQQLPSQIPVPPQLSPPQFGPLPNIVPKIPANQNANIPVRSPSNHRLLTPSKQREIPPVVSRPPLIRVPVVQQKTPMHKPIRSDSSSNGALVQSQRLKGSESRSPVAEKVPSESSNYFEYILTYGYRSRKGFQAVNPGKVNQDALVICTNINSQTYQHYFGVCDGHGAAGKQVSGALRENFISLFNQFNETEEVKSQLMRIYARNNQKLQSEAKFDLNFSGSTSVGCLLRHNKLYSCNVGDSRAVVGKLDPSKKWVAQSLSKDHKTTDPVESERIIKAGGQIEPLRDAQNNPNGCARVWLMNQNYPGLAMTRSFGDLVASGVGVIPTPQIEEFTLSREDKILVVASDGVWQFLSNQNVIDLIAPYYEKKQTEEACTRLLDFAVSMWNSHLPETVDDISFVVAFLDYEVEEEL